MFLVLNFCLRVVILSVTLCEAGTWLEIHLILFCNCVYIYNCNSLSCMLVVLLCLIDGDSSGFCCFSLICTLFC